MKRNIPAGGGEGEEEEEEEEEEGEEEEEEEGEEEGERERKGEGEGGGLVEKRRPCLVGQREIILGMVVIVCVVVGAFVMLPRGPFSKWREDGGG